MVDFIAEVCSNHNNDLTRALSLIDTAADIGCSAVKFQLFRLDKLFAPEVLTHPDYDFVRQRRAWELPLEWLPVLANRCRQRGIKFGCTPFYLEAADELLPYVDFYKVASYNLLDTRLLTKVAGTGKPVVLSTGMAELKEVSRAVETVCTNGGNGESLTLLHCVSVYPTPLNGCDPDFFYNLRDRFICDLGWSDHTVNAGAIYYFVLDLGASMVEFHLDLDGTGNEYGLGHCWLPEQIAPVIKNICDAQEVWTGNLTGQMKAEQAERLWRADPADGLRPLQEMRERL